MVCSFPSSSYMSANAQQSGPARRTCPSPPGTSTPMQFRNCQRLDSAEAPRTVQSGAPENAVCGASAEVPRSSTAASPTSMRARAHLPAGAVAGTRCHAHQPPHPVTRQLPASQPASPPPRCGARTNGTRPVFHSGRKARFTLATGVEAKCTSEVPLAYRRKSLMYTLPNPWHFD